MRVIFKYEFCRGTNIVQTAQNIKEVFGEDVANEYIVRWWFVEFHSEDFRLENVLCTMRKHR